MPYIFLTIFFLLSCLSSFGQKQIENLVIELPEFYKGEGVIFDDSVDLRIKLDSMLRRFTPAIKDIEKAENILLNQYVDLYKRYYKKWKRDYTLSEAEKKDWEVFIDSLSKNQDKLLKHYNRQYAGYIDFKGNERTYYHKALEL